MNDAPTPTVSVLIPTWNRKARVVEAIDSVRAQTLPDFELLVVDDGSTDGTLEALTDRYAGDARISVSRIDHAGVSAARNAALDRSRGRYVAFLDSDDVMLPTRLEVQTAVLAAHPEAALAHGDARLEGGDRPADRLSDVPWFEPPRSLAAMFAGGWGSPSCMLLDGDVARALRFDPEFLQAEDTELLFRFFIAGHRLVWHPDVLSVYRHHQGDAGAAQLSRDLIGRADARLRMMRRHAAHAPDPERYRSVENHLCRRIARAHVEGGRYRAARPYVLHLWRRRPFRPRLAWWWLRGLGVDPGG